MSPSFCYNSVLCFLQINVNNTSCMEDFCLSSLAPFMLVSYQDVGLCLSSFSIEYEGGSQVVAPNTQCVTIGDVFFHKYHGCIGVW